MGKSIVFLFSGQGSQYYNMASKLYKGNEVFRDSMKKLDKMASLLIGDSVLENMYDINKKFGNSFSELKYTHPAIFMVEYSMTQVLIEHDITPDYLLGTSLGEFCALAVSGALTPEYVLEMIVNQSKVFQNHSTQKGGMMAILADASLYLDPAIQNNAQLVAVNYDEHFVIAESLDNLREVGRHLKDKNITYQLLPVEYAFHSSLINEVEPYFRNFFDISKLSKSKIPMISGIDGSFINEIDEDYLWNIVRGPMRFPQAIHNLEEKGNHIYIDVGPSGTLANFGKKIIPQDSDSKFYSIITPFNTELKALQKLLDEI